MQRSLEPVAQPHYDKVAAKVETTLSSEHRGWKNLQLYVYYVVPQPEPTVGPIGANAHTLPVLLRGSGNRAQLYPGSMSLTPRGVPTVYSWTETYVLAHLHLTPISSLAAADLSRADPERAELAPTPFFHDAFIEQVCLALVAELETGGLCGALYTDTLAQALTLHLLRHYSSLSSTADLPERGLSRRHLHLVQDFIRDYLATDISLGDLAHLTGLSPSTFAKGFKRSTGLPPHQYLIQRRVARAKELLSSAALSVAEVAQAVGFFDQSHLIRHFKYWVGMTPKDYRRSRLSN